MTISMAIFLIVILLIYDFMFLKMLCNRKQKTRFSLDIENGEIRSVEGKISSELLSAIKQLCKTYQPGKIKISAVFNKNRQQNSLDLHFSGTLPDELKKHLLACWKESIDINSSL